MTKVFGEGSPEWNEGRDSQIAPFATAARAKALTDFVGIAIHCAAGGGICRHDANAKPDRLPDEPGGYTGFEGLFGAKYVNPAINDGSAAVERHERRPDRRPVRPARLPGLRRRAREGVARLHRADAGGRRADHVRLHLGRPRQPPERVPGAAGPERRLPARFGPGRVGLRPDAARVRPGVRDVLQPAPPRRDHEAEHAVRLHRRRERPLRRRQLDRRHVEPHVLQRGRGPAVPREPDRRGQREPARADPERPAELLGAQRLGSDGLRERRSAAHGRRAPQARA